MAPEERAREGVFMSFQSPVEIPGVTNAYFMRAAVNAVRKHKGEPELDPAQFLKLAREKMKDLVAAADGELAALAKRKPVAVYCDSGYRASIGASILKQEGFQAVSNVPGSWQAWKKAGFPIAGKKEP